MIVTFYRVGTVMPLLRIKVLPEQDMTRERGSLKADQQSIGGVGRHVDFSAMSLVFSAEEGRCQANCRMQKLLQS